MSKQLEWWGYKHVNGTYQVKRYVGKQDLHEAVRSDFVESVYPPFYADDRDSAFEKIKKLEE